MCASSAKLPVVLVVEAESVSSALQAALGADRVEVILSRHTGQARMAAASKRPAVVVVPTPGGDLQQVKYLRGVLPPAVRILGLVSPGDSTDVPEGVNRVACLAEIEAVVAAVEALIEEAATAAEWAGSLAAFVDAKASAGVPGRGAQGAGEDEDADVDPGRVADIRDLATSIQMHRSMAGGGGAAVPAQALGISLSSPVREDPSQVDIAVGSVAEALADLPDPAEAKTNTEQFRVQALERDAARVVAEEAARDRQAQAAALADIRVHGAARVPTQAIELAFVQRRRRGRLVKLVVGLVLGVSISLGGLLLWQHRQAERRRNVKPPRPEKLDEAILARAEAARRRGQWVDPFSGLIVRTPVGVRASDLDFSDEQLHRSVPELDHWFEKALLRLPVPKVREQLLGKAIPLVRFDDRRKARGYLDRVLKIQDGADVRELFATVEEKDGHREKAEGHLERALRLAPKRHDLRMRLGLLYLGTGKAKEGCRELERAAAKLDKARAALEKRCPGAGGAP